MLMSRAVRQTRVATGGQASEHQARATWVNMLLCARWRVTHLFLSLRNFHIPHDRKGRGGAGEPGSLCQHDLACTARPAVPIGNTQHFKPHLHTSNYPLGAPFRSCLSSVAGCVQALTLHVVEQVLIALHVELEAD